MWMLVNRPTDARDPTLAEERRMQFGIDFGRDVTKLFPGGVEITADECGSAGGFRAGRSHARLG